jgi:hypothetical protein
MEQAENPISTITAIYRAATREVIAVRCLCPGSFDPGTPHEEVVAEFGDRFDVNIEEAWLVLASLYASAAKKMAITPLEVAAARSRLATIQAWRSRIEQLVDGLELLATRPDLLG